MVLVIANTSASEVPVRIVSRSGLLSVTGKTDIICENNEGRMIASVNAASVAPFGVSLFRLKAASA